MNKDLSHLELSKVQSTDIKEILHKFRAQLKEFEELKEEIEKKRKGVFLKKIFDVEELDKLNNKLDIKAREIEKSFLIKIHTILHPKQRIKFIDHFDDWEVE